MMSESGSEKLENVQKLCHKKKRKEKLRLHFASHPEGFPDDQ